MIIVEFTKILLKDCFLDENNNEKVYATLKIHNHYDTIDLDTTFAKRLLINQYEIETKKIDLHVSFEELEKRRKQWSPPKPNYTSGALAKYATLVGSAAQGAVTSPNL